MLLNKFFYEICIIHCFKNPRLVFLYTHATPRVRNFRQFISVSVLVFPLRSSKVGNLAR